MRLAWALEMDFWGVLGGMRWLMLAQLCQPTAAAATVETYKGDLLNKTYYPTSADAANVSKKWYVIDAEGKTLGRLACLAATYIR